MPSALPWSAGLTTIGKARRSSIAPRASEAPSSLKAVSVNENQSGRGDAGVAQQVLGRDLVQRPHAGRDAGAGVGDPERLEELLDRPVLAVAPVQGHERDVGRGPAQPGDEVGPGVDGHDLVPQALERVLHPRAGPQRHLALERSPALQDGDAHQAPSPAW